MKNFFTKFIKSKKKLNHIERSFLEMKNITKASNIFNAISNYNETSDIRYVGGCIRKILNNEDVDDIDLATNLKPNEVKVCLKQNNINFFETGIEHGTITAQIDKKNFEITTLRKDVLTDGRKAIVEFTDKWNEDASRRDFTINSIYADIAGNLFDPLEGVKDLKNGIVQFIGNPETRIKEDYLRILRYIRFFLNYSHQNHTINVKKAIKENIDGIIKLSKERLLDELKKLVISEGFKKINNDDFCKEILLLIFPQIKNLDKLKKLNKFSKTRKFKNDFIFILSLLIIDETDNSDYFLYKYKLSNEEKKRICFFKEAYDKSDEENFFSKKTLQKVFYFKGKSDLLDLIDFHLFKSNKKLKKLIELRSYFEKLEKPLFPIKAKTVMEKYNFKEGKELGQRLKYLEKLWVENNFEISDKDVDKAFLN